MKARNYIIVAVPNNKTLQAVLVSRLTSGLLLEYVETEFVCAAEMVAVFGRLKENESMEAVAASQSEMRAESNGIPKNVALMQLSLSIRNAQTDETADV